MFIIPAAIAFLNITIQESRPRAPEKLVIIELGAGAKAFHKSAQRLAKLRNCEIEAVGEFGDGAALRQAVAKHEAGAVAVFVGPADLDINLNRKIYDSISKIDDDPFPDASIGYFTGARPEDVEGMLDAMERAEREGLPEKRVHAGIATTDQYLKYPTYGDTGGAAFEGVFLPTSEKCKDPRAALARFYEDTKGAGIITFSGNGDPMRAWLFSGDRNRHRELHWPFAPEKILRDFTNADMPAFGAGDLKHWNPTPAVLWFSTCHSGVPCRAMVAGDIVSTFGDPGRNIYFYNLKPEESFCLNVMALRPSAFVAPIGPNHGFSTDVELSRAIGENLSVGEAIRRNWIDLALAWRAEGGVPLTLQFEGKPEAIPQIGGAKGGGAAIMREGTLNRILYGDPTFRPFGNIKNRRPTLEVAVNIKDGDATARVEVAIKDAHSGEAWDPYHGPVRMERVTAGFDVPAGFAGIESLETDGALPLEGGDWIVEKRRGLPSRVWFAFYTKAPADYTKRALWIDGAKYNLTARFAKEAARAMPSGAIRASTAAETGPHK
ncbi:MAG: hypothetical protein HY286_16900 [Planctomycetes bacterium]|nr:hypothetical protein [Planctomycetota bacterium]